VKHFRGQAGLYPTLIVKAVKSVTVLHIFIENDIQQKRKTSVLKSL